MTDKTEPRVRVEARSWLGGEWSTLQPGDLAKATVRTIRMGHVRVVTEHPDGTESRVSMVEAIGVAAHRCRFEANAARWKGASGGTDYDEHIAQCESAAAALSLLLPEEDR